MESPHARQLIAASHSPPPMECPHGGPQLRHVTPASQSATRMESPQWDPRRRSPARHPGAHRLWRVLIEVHSSHLQSSRTARATMESPHEDPTQAIRPPITRLRPHGESSHGTLRHAITSSVRLPTRLWRVLWGDPRPDRPTPSPGCPPMESPQEDPSRLTSPSRPHVPIKNPHDHRSTWNTQNDQLSPRPPSTTTVAGCERGMAGGAAGGRSALAKRECSRRPNARVGVRA